METAMQRELNELRRLAGLPEVDEASVRASGIEKAKAPTHEALVEFSKKTVKLAKDLETSISGLGATNTALSKMVDMYWQQNPSVYDTPYNQAANLLRETNKKLQDFSRMFAETRDTLEDVAKTIQKEFKEQE